MKTMRGEVTCLLLVGLAFLLWFYVITTAVIAAFVGIPAGIGWALLTGWGLWWWRRKARATLLRRQRETEGR
jgi:hypothetical protein